MIEPTFICVSKPNVFERKSIIDNNEWHDAMNYAKARAKAHFNRGWRDKGISLQDLESAAFEGITEAAAKFEPERGSVQNTKFTSYAHFWIEKYIMEYITNNKSILSSKYGEAYVGLVPYTYSIDKTDSTKPNQDSYAFLGVHDLNEIEQKENRILAMTIIERALITLPEYDRTIVLLHFGVGTINNESVPIKTIAKLMQTTEACVTTSLQNSMNALTDCQETLKHAFSLLCS